MPLIEPSPIPKMLANRNVLVVAFDDLGKEKLACYGAQPFQPPTPNLTAQANAGVRFNNCIVNPACSHTRALALTGRYGLRTGIVGVIDTDLEAPLPAGEIIIPGLLKRASPGQVRSALIGKWHLSNAQNGSWVAPNRFGFDYFAGMKGNIRSDGGSGYFSWKRGVNGRVATEATYNTTKLVDDAIAFMASATTPWFLWLAFAAPHTPFDRPPASLYDISAYNSLGMGLPYPLADATAPSGQEAAYFNAMLQAADAEHGRLMAAVNTANTTVFTFGDNGTTSSAVTPPFDPAHGKASGYELAINCPLIVSGNGVASPGRTSDALVSIGDLFTTIAALYGLDPATVLPKGRTIDGVSFKGILDSAGGTTTRTRAYSEQFNVNSPYPRTTMQLAGGLRAFRDARYKLLKKWQPGTGKPMPDEFYDLQVDPQEAVNLLSVGLSPSEAVEYAARQAELDALLATV